MTSMLTAETVNAGFRILSLVKPEDCHCMDV
jgi:hypothetical protein